MLSSRAVRKKNVTKTEGSFLCSVRAREYLEFYRLENLKPQKTLTLALYAFVSSNDNKTIGIQFVLSAGLLI